MDLCEHFVNPPPSTWFKDDPLYTTFFVTAAYLKFFVLLSLALLLQLLLLDTWLFDQYYNILVIAQLVQKKCIKLATIFPLD